MNDPSAPSEPPTLAYPGEAHAEPRDLPPPPVASPTDASAGMAPGLAPGLAPGMAPGMTPGLAPGMGPPPIDSAGGPPTDPAMGPPVALDGGVPPASPGMAPNAQGPYRIPGNDQPPPPPPEKRVPLRAFILGIGAVLAIFALIAAVLLRPGPPKKARSIGARLDLAAGEVSVDAANGETKAISGTPLASGATVKTAKGARALVRTGEGAAIFLRGETTLKLLDRGVEVDAGEIWLDAPHVDGEALEVKAGEIVISAADAGISIRRDGKNVTAYVARGLAVLTSPGGRVEVNAGEQGTVKSEGKPEVAAVAFWQDWTGGMGDQRGSRFVGSGTGRLYGLDPLASAGAPARKLGIAKQVVRAVIREGIAETEVDQTFSNPGGQPIEGWYWFTVPTSATVTGFALETNGQLVEGEVIEKREAAARYEAAIRQAVDPALLEWVDGRTYRARVFPIPASGTRRIVLRYVEMLPTVEGKTRYVYPLRSDDPVRFDEFALSVDVGSEQDVDVASSLDARVEPGGRVVSMRRSGYVPRADFQLEIGHKKKRSPVAAWRFSAGADQADYVMLRYVPERDFAKEPPAAAEVVFVVDTSAGGDETARQLRIAAAEAAMRALSERDHFALVALDVAPTVVYPKEGLSAATEADITAALEKLSDHSVGGATDLGAMFEPALARLHGKEQAALVYVGDGAPTSGETGAEALLDRLRRSLTGSRARFFAIGTGADAHHELLTQLTRAGGGQYVRIDEPSQTTGYALRLTSAIKTATITDVAIDLGAGLDQPLYSATGKLSRGEELVLLARTHHPLPEKVSVHGRIGGKDFDEKYDVKVDTSSVTASLVPRLWAAEYARRLMGAGEESRGQVLQLGVEYGLITPYTSSLALENEAAYARQGIVRKRSVVRGVRLTSIESSTDEERLMRGLGVVVAPPTMMGCDKASRSSDREERVSAAAAPMSENAPSPAVGGAATATATPTFDTDRSADAKDGLPRAAGGLAALGGDTTPSESSGLALGAGGGPGGGGFGGGVGLSNNGAGGGASAPRAMAPAKPSPSVASVAPSPVSKQKAARRDDESKALSLNRVAPNAAPAATLSAQSSAAYRVALVRALARCSDVASRPLSERIVVWQKRAKKAEGAVALAKLYDQAYAACELPDWRDEAALLDIVQQRIDTEQAAEIVLGHFAGYPDDQRFLAKNLLRRTVDLRIAATVSRVMYGGVDWLKVDREIGDLDKADKQLTRLKTAMLAAPGDPQGEVRLVKLLAKTGQRQEALAHGRRLRDRGFLTPTLAQQLGDVLADAGEADEALRTYSEIVEFDGQNAVSRRVLGDVFLRQGWYPAAYRQYKTLTDLDAKNPLAWLRLANAAAGSGRVDEALRIDREVASGEGTPGPNDPRMFARLLSAARLGALLDKPDPAAGITLDAVSRKLKELSLFSGPGTLMLLTWEDLDAQLVVGALDEKKEQLVGEATDAGAVGLYAVLGAEALDAAPHAARYKGEVLSRKVPFRVVTLAWDGKAFRVTTKKGVVEAGVKQAAL